MALTQVAPGQVAAVVTHLEMRDRPRPAPVPPAPFALVRWKRPDLGKYRLLFERVGAPWLWFSRLVIEDDALAVIVHDGRVEVFAVTDRQGLEIGMLELDFRQAGACELAFFGLIPELTGKGHGRWLMAQAVSLGWRRGVEMLKVHTCTLDHPAALGFYRRAGFVPIKREIEVFDDPRLRSWLPREAAPQIPLLDS